MYLTKQIQVRTMNSRSGNPIPNQIIITEDAWDVFVSYGSKIAFRSHERYNGKHQIVLDKDYWNYSRTTGKYRNEFLGFGVDECRRGLKEGWIKLGTLN